MSRKLKDMQEAVEKGLKKAEKKKMGAPRFPYTEKLANEICRTIALTPCGLDKICEENSHFPNPSTIYEWVIENPDFAKRYDKAKERQVDMYVNDMMRIARDDSNDLIPGSEGGLVGNPTAVNRHRLQIDSIKWYAGKLKRRVYGDKSTVETIDLTHEQGLENLDK